MLTKLCPNVFSSLEFILQLTLLCTDIFYFIWYTKVIKLLQRLNLWWFGHSKEKIELQFYIISNIANAKNKLLENCKLSKCLIFKVQAFWWHLKSKSYPNLTRNKNFETLSLYPTFALFDPYVLFYLSRVIRISVWRVWIAKYIEIMLL